MIDKDLLEEMVQSAISEYCCDSEDYDLDIIIEVTVKNGWVERPIIKEKNYEERSKSKNKIIRKDWSDCG